MNKLVIVKPKRTDLPDGSMNHYDYPSANGMQTQVVTYNRTRGDFLKEQLWLISGTQEQIDKFIGNPEVSAVGSWDEADKLTQIWEPVRKIMNNPGAVVEAVDAVVKILKEEGKPVPAILDPDNPVPGIVMRRFNLSDHVKPEVLL